MIKHIGKLTLAATLGFSASNLYAQSMLSPAVGFEVDVLHTVGESVGGFTPVGILDGLGAFELDANTVRVISNHELLNFRGPTYTIPTNAIDLVGARLSAFDIDKTTRQVVSISNPVTTLIDHNGNIAVDASLLANDFNGFSRFCSSAFEPAGQFDGRGLENGIYFTGEEDGGFFNGVGGNIWGLDVSSGNFYALPALGRGGWENIVEVDTGTTDSVAFILADDSSPFDFDGDSADEAAPLYLYVGEKNATGDFAAQNGLRDGSLFVFVPDNAAIQTPADFNGSGSITGTWVEIDNTPQPTMGSEDGITGFDEFGYPTQSTLITQAEAINAFGFSRPEDVSANPADGSQLVLASTGVDTYVGGADTFGTVYLIDNDFADIDAPTATISILYDGDADSTRALRSPDNLDWADNGLIYIQEDEAEEDSLTGEPLFGAGAANPREASIVQLNPETGAIQFVASVDRNVILDPSNTDSTPIDQDAGEAGEWETSGILDVSELFDEAPGTLFVLDVQAHGIDDQDDVSTTSLITDDNLGEGGQLLLLSGSVALGGPAPAIPALNKPSLLLLVMILLMVAAARLRHMGVQ